MSWLPAVVSGLLLGLAFPFRVGAFALPNLGWLAWIALVPLFLTLRRATPRQAFARTYCAAVIYYSISLYWLYTAMHTYGHLTPPIACGVLALTILILAAYISVVPWITRWIASRWEREPLWLLPTVWVAVELARNHGPCGGFPWSNLAQTQFAYIPLIQIVDITGIGGLTFVMVSTNRWFAHVWGRWREGDWDWREGRTWCTVALWLLLIGYGTWRFVAVERAMAHWTPYTVALLQGNIPQEDKWRPGLEEEQVAVYHRLMAGLAGAPVDLAIWPEASYPWGISVASRELPVAGQFPVLLGALGVQGSGAQRRLFNSAFLLTPDGAIAGRYDKTHLVPFGEYVPYQKLLFFARRLAAPIGDYGAGTRIEPLRIGPLAIGTLICYEDIFPEIARGHAVRGAQFFANLTNDAWYGWSAAATQHLTLSVFRAVEHRRFLVRATNTGVSAIVDPLGRRIITGGLFEPAVIVGRIRLGEGRTIYTMCGDWFAWSCVLALAGGWVMAMRVGRKRCAM